MAPKHGVALNEKLWPPEKHYLKVRFRNGHEWQRSLVREVIKKHYNQIPMRIRFQFLEDKNPSPSDIRVKFSSETKSLIGRDAEKHRGETTLWLNLNSNIKDKEERRLKRQGDILHEFGHALGMEHEHSHPDCKLKWDWRALQGRTGWDAKKVHANYDKIYSAKGKLAPYDPKSIMHYSVHRGDTVRGRTTIPSNNKLSDGDKKFLATIYPVRKPKPSTDLVRPRKLMDEGKLDKYHRTKQDRHHNHVYKITGTVVCASNNKYSAMAFGKDAFVGVSDKNCIAMATSSGGAGAFVSVRGNKYSTVAIHISSRGGIFASING